jgi:hypothetical protein
MLALPLVMNLMAGKIPSRIHLTHFTTLIGQCLIKYLGPILMTPMTLAALMLTMTHGVDWMKTAIWGLHQ